MRLRSHGTSSAGRPIGSPRLRHSSSPVSWPRSGPTLTMSLSTSPSMGWPISIARAWPPSTLLFGASFLPQKPQTIGHVESAAIPLAALSAWQGLFDHGGLTNWSAGARPGRRRRRRPLRVQLARDRGAYVIGATSARATRSVRELGADEVVTAIPDVIRAGGPRVRHGRRRAARAGAGRRSRAAVGSCRLPRSLHDAGGISSTYFVVGPSREQLGRAGEAGRRRQAAPDDRRGLPVVRSREAFERTMGDRRGGKVVLQVVDE